MKYIPLLAAILAFTFSHSARAEDVGQFTGTLGCAHHHYETETGSKTCRAALKAGDRVFLLTGPQVTKDFEKGGEWVVEGTLSADVKSIEVRKMKKSE